MGTVNMQYESIGSMEAIVELTWKYAQRLSYYVFTVAVAFKFELRN